MGSTETMGEGLSQGIDGGRNGAVSAGTTVHLSTPRALPLRAPERGCMRHDDDDDIVVVHSRFSALRMPSHAISHYIVVTSYCTAASRQPDVVGYAGTWWTRPWRPIRGGSQERQWAGSRSSNLPHTSAYLAHGADDTTLYVANKWGKTNVGWRLYSRTMAVVSVGIGRRCNSTHDPDSGRECLRRTRAENRQGDVPGLLVAAGTPSGYICQRTNDGDHLVASGLLAAAYNDTTTSDERITRTSSKQRLLLPNSCDCLPVQGPTYCLSMPQLRLLVDSLYRSSHQIVSTVLHPKQYCRAASCNFWASFVASVATTSRATAYIRAFRNHKSGEEYSFRIQASLKKDFVLEVPGFEA
ncbi:hypothetical protein BDW22DRAFT_1349475 [Trametopsis cervina]|nr:hypothetical protein BDW22DRAFT_1349475 [Trametopsis cervina]